MMYETKIKVPCRLSYARINEPYVGKNGEKKYSVTCLISKDDTKTMERVETAIAEAINEGLHKKWDEALPEALRTPVNDGDVLRPNDPAYKNMWFISATTTERPVLVDRNVEIIHDRKMVYSGCRCNVILDFFPYASGQLKGIAAELGNIQLISQDESLLGQSIVKREFEVIE